MSKLTVRVSEGRDYSTYNKDDQRRIRNFLEQTGYQFRSRTEVDQLVKFNRWPRGATLKPKDETSTSPTSPERVDLQEASSRVSEAVAADTASANIIILAMVANAGVAEARASA